MHITYLPTVYNDIKYCVGTYEWNTHTHAAIHESREGCVLSRRTYLRIYCGLHLRRSVYIIIHNIIYTSYPRSLESVARKTVVYASIHRGTRCPRCCRAGLTIGNARRYYFMLLYCGVHSSPYYRYNVYVRMFECMYVYIPIVGQYWQRYDFPTVSARFYTVMISAAVL